MNDEWYGWLLVFAIAALPFVALIVLVVLIIRDSITKKFHTSTKIMGAIIVTILVLTQVFATVF